MASDRYRPEEIGSADLVPKTFSPIVKTQGRSSNALIGPGRMNTRLRDRSEHLKYLPA